MARNPAARSTYAVILEAIRPVVVRVSRALVQSMEREVASRLAKELKSSSRSRSRPGLKHRRVTKADLTKWIADHRARRVPTFVIELTGLETKKKIVAKYGPDSVFEKGKPLPEAKTVPGPPAAKKEATIAAKAKPPVVRKAAGAK